jgi:hypothetical protein
LVVRARQSIGIVALVAALWHTPAWSQGVRTPAGPGRRTTTLTALATYPLFFNGQPVRVRAAAREENGLFSLEDGGTRVWLVAAPNGRLPDAKSTSDVYGVFFDVGRLDPGDQRVTGDFGALSQRVLNRATPNPGELLVILVERSEQAEPLSAPSVRNVALDPNRYVDQEVTVVGRFRGRNLYGDLPDAPGKSRWDFVLQSADSSVWVTGRRPRGDGFDLNIDNRVDTGRWLEVAGVVKLERGLVRLEATAIRPSQPPAQSAPEALVKVPVHVPPPEVIFSAPTADETDVEPTASIRIQFSRDVKAESIKGHVTAGYVGSNQPFPAFTATYDGGRRVLEIKFATPLEPFSTVRIALTDGIVGGDGQAVKPWTLSFVVGS